MQRITILFLAADPSNLSRLRLGEEQREIQEKLRLGNMRDRFIFESRTSVRTCDVLQALHDVRPQIIHFAGHGTTEGQICLEDNDGKSRPVASEPLSNLFELITDHVRCVVLNACFSEVQAHAIAQHIPYVVGMPSAVKDEAAIAFAAGFYRAIAAGRSFPEAYRWGIVELSLAQMDPSVTPVLLEKGGAPLSHTSSSYNHSSITDARNQTESNTTKGVTIILDKDLMSFTPAEQNSLVFALSRIVDNHG